MPKTPRIKSSFVIDTNVLLSASEKANHTNKNCVLDAVKILRKIEKEKILIHLDQLGEIIAEYRNKNYPGRGKVGDRFLLYLVQNSANKKLTNHVEIKKDAVGNYHDFPSDPQLLKFHIKDRKFVAVAIASLHNPPILNAGDKRSWQTYKRPLQEHVALQFLCKCP